MFCHRIRRPSILPTLRCVYLARVKAMTFLVSKSIPIKFAFDEVLVFIEQFMNDHRCYVIIFAFKLQSRLNLRYEHSHYHNS